MKAERRYFKAEVRATDGASPKITGHAAVFNSRSLDLGGFVEIIAPGAFDECLASAPDIVGLWAHDDMQLPLGRTTSGTMKVAVDSVGLSYEIDPPDTTLARDLMVSMKRGDIDASSFGFYCLDDDWSLDPETDQLIRTVLKASIFDCSPVVFPAYPDADSGLRSLTERAGMAELRTVAAAKRAALTRSMPDATGDDRETTARLETLLYLAGK